MLELNNNYQIIVSAHLAKLIQQSLFHYQLVDQLYLYSIINTLKVKVSKSFLAFMVAR